MGASLGPVMANIILTELEKHIITKLFKNNTLKFYMRYVDDTLVLMKRKDVDYVLSELNSFHPNLKFTVDTFDDKEVHFLDIKIHDNSTDVYYKQQTQDSMYTLAALHHGVIKLRGLIPFTIVPRKYVVTLNN